MSFKSIEPHASSPPSATSPPFGTTPPSGDRRSHSSSSALSQFHVGLTILPRMIGNNAPRQKAQQNTGARMSCPKDAWIQRLVPGKSFIDVGGLWGTVNEKVTVAL